MSNIQRSNYVEKEIREAVNKVTEVENKLNNKFDKDAILTMDNMGQDIKIAMTGGSVAVVGNNCVNTNNFTQNVREALCSKSFDELQTDTAQTVGFYRYNDGVYEDLASASFKYYQRKYEVVSGRKYYVTGKASGENAALCVFFDSDNSYKGYYLSFKEEGHIIKAIDQEITIPEGVAYMSVITNDLNLYPIKLKDCNYIPINVNNLNNLNSVTNEKLEALQGDITDEKAIKDFEIESLQNRCTFLSKYNKLDWKDLDKGYVTFCFDDGRHDISTVIDLFNTNNIPLCLAIPSDTLENNCDNNKTVKENCLQLQNNGGEILSHSTDVNTFNSSTTDEVALKRIKDSKYLLTQAGLKIRGMIKPGGSDSVSNLGTKWQKYIEAYYDYGDEIGLTIPYAKGRKGMATRTLEEVKALIDDAATNNKWLILYGHTLDGTEATDFNSDKMQTIIDYVKSKSNIQVVTYSTMIDTNCINALEKRIISIENKG